MHYREAANTARRLLFMGRRFFSELSKAAFIPLYCALVRPHLEYAIEANSLNLRADIKHAKGVPCEERLRQLDLLLERRRLRADLISGFKIFKGVLDISPSAFSLHPPRIGLRVHT